MCVKEHESSFYNFFSVINSLQYSYFPSIFSTTLCLFSIIDNNNSGKKTKWKYCANNKLPTFSWFMHNTHTHVHRSFTNSILFIHEVFVHKQNTMYAPFSSDIFMKAFENSNVYVVNNILVLVLVDNI